jgi:hypothetical protein
MRKSIKAKIGEDADPLDGKKAVGCLFLGIGILAIVMVLFGLFINWLKT